MSDKTFNKGDIVCNLRGEQAELVAIDNGICIVRLIYFDEYDENNEPIFGDIQEWSQAFKIPPTQKLHKEVEDLNISATHLRLEIEKLQEEKARFVSDLQDRLNIIKKHKQLKLLEDFIEGKITHYVQVGWDERIQIIAFSKAVCEGNIRDLKLLTLFGKSNGDLEFNLSRYSDGDYNNICTVVPCTSYEMAIEETKRLFEQVCEDCRKNNNQTFYIKNIIESVIKYGVDIPEDIKLLVKTQEIQKAEAAAEDAQSKLDLAKSLLEKVKIC